MLDNIYQLPLDQVAAIEWQGNDLHYDLQLYELGNGHDEFLALIPDETLRQAWYDELRYYIEEIPHSRKCIVFTYKGNWLAKIFKAGWYPYHGYETVEIVKPQYIWAKNPDVDKLMSFVDDPFASYRPDSWEKDYKLIWYIDPRFDPTGNKVWAMSVSPVGKEILGTKDMGYLTPDVTIMFNEHLPDLGINVDECCPPFWDLAYECAYELDPIHQTPELGERMWVIKFTPNWRKPKEWKWYGVVSPQYHIIYNPELPNLDYDLDYVIAWHDFGYEHVWMLDRKHLSNGEEDIWAFTLHVTTEQVGSKTIDYISPNIKVEYNSDLPKMNYNIDYTIPWHDLGYEHVWMLDRKHLSNGEEDIWAFKLTAAGNKVGYKEIGHTSPLIEVEYNSTLPKMNYDIDYIIPWHDFGYEHGWMLDRKHLSNGEEDIWAFKLTATNDVVGYKQIDYTSPLIEVDTNPALPKMKYDLTYTIPWYDLAYDHIWYLNSDHTGKDNIWALRMRTAEISQGEKVVGIVTPMTTDQLDVVFISYYELNAESNWQRLLEKVPNAKRVDGVTGIFEAHKAAARLAKTDMFFVVDGDAYLEDDWQFDFQPGIFDRDCTYVWNSRNPVTNLTYGYGGVKLFTTSKVKSLKSWGTDLTLSVSKKLMVMERVSNVTQFNTSEYNTWKAAFRECAKLAKKTDAVSKSRLQAWLTPDESATFSTWAKLGAEQGIAFAENNTDITQVNDYTWLKKEFINNYNSI